MSSTGTIVSAKIQEKGTEKAAKAQITAAREAQEHESEMLTRSIALTAPWREAGTEALGRLETKISAGPGEFIPSEDPGYEFGYKEFVEKPLLREAAAGNALSDPATNKALTRYAQDYAGTKYQSFMDRWYKSLTPDQSLAGVGQTIATGEANRAVESGRSVASNILAAGDARATGYINQGNIQAQAAKDQSQNAMSTYMMFAGGF